jgi:hypothetical protein
MGIVSWVSFFMGCAGILLAIIAIFVIVCSKKRQLPSCDSCPHKMWNARWLKYECNKIVGGADISLHPGQTYLTRCPLNQ